MRRAVVAAAVSALLLAPAAAASAKTAPPRLSKERAIRLFLAEGKVSDWVDRYPQRSLLPSATFEPASRDWTVFVWSTVSSPLIEIARGVVDDRTGRVTEAFTGPQVTNLGARGIKGAIGGTLINRVPVWLAFCAVFLLGLCDLRRLRSVRNLDLLALLSFSVSLWFFNKGRIFTSVPLVYPPLLYLLARTVWIGRRGRPPIASRAVWPVWLLAAATLCLAGVRIGLNVQSSNMFDVGNAGVLGAQRIAHGQAPYGRMPFANVHGDTYGPVLYQAYLPGYAAFGSKGTGTGADVDRAGLHDARFTSILFDLLCLIGLALVGRRFGGARLAATLTFAWAAYPFTQYVSSAHVNDAIQPAFLIWGFWLASSPAARGAFTALASWTKLASLVVAPLWATYPDARRPLHPKFVFSAAFAVTTLVAFWILLLEPDPLHAARVFWDRTIAFQIGRDSPFSIWDWRVYHAGLPDLHVLQIVLQVALGIGAVAVAFVPRRKSPLQLAALTAAVLIGFELVLTHWSYLYLPWFFPFAAFAVLAPPAPRAAEEPE